MTPLQRAMLFPMLREAAIQAGASEAFVEAGLDGIAQCCAAHALVDTAWLVARSVYGDPHVDPDVLALAAFADRRIPDAIGAFVRAAFAFDPILIAVWAALYGPESAAMIIRMRAFELVREAVVDEFAGDWILQT